MQYIQNANRTDLLILKRGEELHSVLNAYAAEHDLKSAWLNGVGGAGKTTLGFYNFEAREYEWRDFDGPLEILSLQGNLAIVNGEPFWHIHGVFSGQDFAAVGGHVKAMSIALTGELHITTLDTTLTRVFDDETGLKLIQPAG
jgi:predicted DNA-binding protein with PD1-like motif